MSVKATIQDQLKGNLNKKFGDNLPVPFIEKVKIEDDLITLTTAIYFNLDEYAVENFDAFIAELGDVHLYAMMAYDREYSATTGSDLTADNMYSDIIAGKKSLFSNLQEGPEYIMTLYEVNNDELEYIHPYTASLHFPESTAGAPGSLYDLGTLADWTLVDTYYNDAGKPVNKLVNTVEISPTTAWTGTKWGYYSPEDDEWHTEGNMDRNWGEKDFLGSAWETGRWGDETSTYGDYGDYFYSGSNTITNAGFITFSSILDLNDMAGDDYTETDAAFEDNDSMKYLYGSLISDMNYISFFKDGALNESKQYVYVKPDGEIVSDAVQALDGYYYAPSKVNLPKIVALFKAVSSPPIIEEEQMPQTPRFLHRLIVI